MFNFFRRKSNNIQTGGIDFIYDLDNSPLDNPIIKIINARGESLTCTEEEVRDLFTKSGVVIRRLNKIRKQAR